MSTNEIAAITSLSPGLHTILLRRDVQMRTLQDAIALHPVVRGARRYASSTSPGTSITKLATEVAWEEADSRLDATLRSSRSVGSARAPMHMAAPAAKLGT